MQTMYKGQPVLQIRPAGPKDKGYVEQKLPEQIVVRYDDGTEVAALASDLTEVKNRVPVLQAAPVTSSEKKVADEKAANLKAKVTAPSTTSFMGGFFKKKAEV